MISSWQLWLFRSLARHHGNPWNKCMSKQPHERARSKVLYTPAKQHLLRRCFNNFQYVSRFVLVVCSQLHLHGSRMFKTSAAKLELKDDERCRSSFSSSCSWCLLSMAHPWRPAAMPATRRHFCLPGATDNLWRTLPSKPLPLLLAPLRYLDYAYMRTFAQHYMYIVLLYIYICLSKLHHATFLHHAPSLPKTKAMCWQRSFRQWSGLHKFFLASQRLRIQAAKISSYKLLPHCARSFSRAAYAAFCGRAVCLFAFKCLQHTLYTAKRCNACICLTCLTSSDCHAPGCAR